MIPTPTTTLTLTLSACTRKIMDEYDNYIDLLLEKGLSAKSDEELAVAIDRENGKREKEEPIFFDHRQMLVRTMEKTRK